MKIISILLILSLSINAYSQNKLSYNVGLKFRITPIYVEKKQPIFFNEKNILLQEDKHLSGTSIIGELIYSFSKVSINYLIGARVDIVESKIENMNISSAKNKLIIDNAFTLNVAVFTKSKYNFLIGVGLGLNNYNTTYTYAKKQVDGSGNVSYTLGSDDFKFQTLNLNFQKDIKKISLGIGIEYAYNHNFFEASSFIIPTILLKYKIKKPR